MNSTYLKYHLAPVVDHLLINYCNHNHNYRNSHRNTFHNMLCNHIRNSLRYTRLYTHHNSRDNEIRATPSSHSSQCPGLAS
jgi:hypothetical protein